MSAARSLGRIATSTRAGGKPASLVLSLRGKRLKEIRQKYWPTQRTNYQRCLQPFRRTLLVDEKLFVSFVAE